MIYTAAHPAFKPIYRCPVCEQDHKAIAAAVRCSNSTPAPSFAVGEFVRLGYPVYGWHNAENPDWIIKTGPEHFHQRELIHFWHVVTHVDTGGFRSSDAHRVRYHIATRGVFNGDSRGWIGYTFDTGHKGLVRTLHMPPPSVVAEAKELIGMKADHLL